MMMDPVVVAVAALKLAGHNVHPENEQESGNIPKEALSAEGYVWVEELGSGTTPHVDYSDRPAVQVVVYDSRGRFKATEIARQVQTNLRLAQGVALPNGAGGIHRTITLIRPHREDLPGLPPGVGRAVAQYELILSSQEKWS